MARRMLVALLTLLLVATPAHAQPGKVLLDMTIQAVPGIPTGHCLATSAGRLLVEAHLTDEASTPVRFSLGPAENVPAILDLQVRDLEPVNGTAPVQAGVYCYMLINEAATAAGDAPEQVSAPGQLIVVRLIWLPSA